MASTSRGMITTTATVPAMRCIHIAAFSLAGARIASIAATSGTGMPVSHEPGASVTDSSACTCSAPRNVLSHDARYSNASPRV